MNFFKAFQVTLTFSSSAFCLQPPYILNAVGQTSRTIAISWRNNDLNSAEFVLYQKIAGAATYSLAGTQTKDGTTFTYNKLVPGSSYLLAAKTVNGIDTSDFSNEVSASTLPGVFASPTVNIAFDSIQTKMTLKISDNSEIETGYEIFKAVGSDTSFNRVAQIQSVNPADTQKIMWEDNAVRNNEWYQYFVRATIADAIWKSALKKIDYYARDSMASAAQSLFTLVYSGLVTAEDSILVLKEKLSEYPIKFNGWSMKIGDSILLGEAGMGDSSYSLINISSPSSPKFSGVVKTLFAINNGTGYAQGTLLYAGSSNISDPGNGQKLKITVLDFNSGKVDSVKEVGLNKKYGVNWVTFWIWKVNCIYKDSLIVFSIGSKSGSYFNYILSTLPLADTTAKYLSEVGNFGGMYLDNVFFFREFFGIINLSGISCRIPSLNLNSIPKQIGNYKSLDPLLQTAKNVICDTSNKIVYVFTDSILYAYGYAIIQTKDPVIFRPNTRLKKFMTSDNNAQAEYFDILGRRIGCSFIRNHGNSSTARIRTSNGIVFIKNGHSFSKNILIN
jgi:hypothetical protein